MRLQHAFLAALACAAALASADPIQPGASPAATRQAIQAAIDAAAAQSPAGTVTLGAGTFEIDAQLMITNGVTLVGQGWDDTTLRQTANGQRVATLAGGARLQGVTATGGRLTAGWTHGPGLLVEDGTVSWCRIVDNVSTGRNVHGGGVNITKGTVDHCIVAFNQAGTYTSSGGGIGTYNTSGTFVIDTCLVHGNTASVTDTAGKGGGICVNMGNPTVTIRNTTIAGNSSSGSGGGFYNGSYGNKVKLVNTLVAGNTADSDADSHDGTLASGSSNNLLGGDPRFVASGNSDYHLASGSPAINAGTAWAGIGDDLDGAAFAATPSIGCYEYFGVLLVDDPAFSPASGVTFSPTLDVALTCETDAATIRYTLDGTDPTEASAEYTGPITLSATTTIRARAYKAGMAASDVVGATYTLGASTPPELGDVTVTPRATAATVSGEILSVGNNGSRSAKPRTVSENRRSSPPVRRPRSSSRFRASPRRRPTTTSSRSPTMRRSFDWRRRAASSRPRPSRPWSRSPATPPRPEAESRRRSTRRPFSRPPEPWSSAKASSRSTRS